MEKIVLSICIPAYDANGEAKGLFARNLDMLKKQTLKDFEIIVTDNSENNTVKNLCENPLYQSLHIKYFKNPRKGIAVNTNEAIKRAGGKFIKILYMDDYLANENSLQDIIDNFKGNWLVTGCGHDKGDGKIKNIHFPKYNKNIYLGKNTIGSPSVITIKNEGLLLFDEDLTWLLDCDYYKRLYDKYGEPEILNKINVVIGLGKHQMTNLLGYKTKWKERKLMQKKYGKNRLLKLFELW